MSKLKKWWWRLRYNYYGWKAGLFWGVSECVDDDELDYSEHPSDAIYYDWIEPGE